MAKLTDAQRVVMNRATQREDGRLTPTPKTPAHIAHSMVKKLEDAKLVERIEVASDHSWYGQGDGDVFFGYRLTLQGFMALGVTSEEWPEYCQPRIEAPEPDCSGIEASVPDGDPELVSMGWLSDEVTSTDAGDEALANPTPEDAEGRGVAEPDAADERDTPLVSTTDLASSIPWLNGARQKEDVLLHPNLAAAAAAFLEVWDTDQARAQHPKLHAKVLNALRVVVKASPSKDAAPRVAREAKTPREGGSKQDAVLTMLRRAEGATNPDVQAATGWAAHTVRGFFAGLKKKGIDVQSAKVDGTTIYRVAS